MKICVIIPTYNEEKKIGGVIKKIRALGIDTLVIDDGSTDTTVKIARENGAVFIKNSRNEGKGASLIRGFNYAVKKNYDAVITLDGDGQHKPEDIPAFVKQSETSNSSMFVGNRMQQTRNMPALRLMTNKFMSWLISLITRQNIPDTQCGFRLIKRGILEKIKLNTANFEIESEMLIRAAQAGYKIESIFISTVYDGEQSRINPFVDTLRFIKFIAKELWTSRR